MRIKLFILVVALLGGVGVLVNPAGAQAPAGMGTVVVVHGLVDFPADVYLDGASTPALSGFEYRRITDPLALPAGTHRADLRRAGQPATAPPALSGTFTVEADQRVTVAALLSPTGSPTWLAFPNDAQPADPSRVQQRFRHFAAAGAVNVVVDGLPLATNVQNTSVGGQLAPAMLAPGRHEVSVVDSAAGTVLVAPQAIDVAAGSIANVYLVGQATAGTLGLLLQDPAVASVAVAAKALDVVPAAVPGGNSGLADPAFVTRRITASPLLRGAIGVAGAGAALVVLLTGMTARRRPAGARRSG